ncbi:MAG: ABC transporter substrate-binding protein [Oscillospiraceae bacterium]|nr:ABC transporter substrate-binding protein [Oscillospiraceae bacterium]
MFKQLKQPQKLIAILATLALLITGMTACNTGNGGSTNQTSPQNAPNADNSGNNDDYSGEPVGEPVKIVVADAKTTHHLNLYVAKELGLFEKYNLDVEIVPVDDNAAARDFVVSGGADVFWTCPTTAIAAIANGAPIKTIAQVKKPCTSVLLVPPESDIKELSDLNGKNISGISPTCEAIISLTVAARNEGATFNLERLAGGPAIQALQAGQVDGAILEEPQASIAELEGYVRKFDDVSANIPCRTINASERFLSSNSDALKDFVKAIDEANEIILADPTAENIVDIAHNYTGAPKDAIIHGNNRLLFGIPLEVEGLKKLADELVAMDDIKENPGDMMFAEAFKGVTW